MSTPRNSPKTKQLHVASLHTRNMQLSPAMAQTGKRLKAELCIHISLSPCLIPRSCSHSSIQWLTDRKNHQPVNQMIDRIEMTIEGEFPPIGKTLAVGQRSGVVSHSHTADSYRLFGTGADYRLHLRELKSGGQALDIDFCPPKILQGHNGLGSNDLIGLALHAVPLIFRDRGIPLSRDVQQRLIAGDYRLREVHVTEHHKMPHESIPALCSAIRRYGPDSLQAVPIERGIGIRLWPNSRSRSVLIYDKLHFFNDVTAGKPFKHLDVLRAGIDPNSYAHHWQAINFEQLLEYLRQGVRIEVKLYSEFLKRRGLERGSAWTADIASRVRQDVLEEVPLGDVPLYSAVDQAIATASPTHRTLIALWAAGRDPRQFATSPATFHRHCKAIRQKYDLDIARPALLLPHSLSWPMLIAAESVLEQAPQFARGDDFFFSPARVRGVVKRRSSVVRPK